MKAMIAFLLTLLACSESTLNRPTSEPPPGPTLYDVVDSGTLQNKNLDVVFYLDTSGSMEFSYGSGEDDLERVINNWDSIVSGLVDSDLHWKVAFSGMNSIDDLSCNANWWTTSSDKDLQNLLDDCIDGIVPGEQGIDAAIDSFTNETSFFREDADLLNVFISDEDHQGSKVPSEYVIYADELKSPPFHVVGTAIVMKEDHCGNSGEEAGEDYMSISQTDLDLCNPTNWNTTFDYTKTTIPKVELIWELSEVPYYPEFMYIHIDGNLWDDWEYNEEDNLIELYSIPEDGKKIEIYYKSVED